MKKLNYLFILLCLVANISFAQTADLTTPENTIKSLFLGMYHGDSTIVRSCFSESMTLNSVFTIRSGEQVVSSGSSIDFLNAVGTPHDEKWIERISNLEIKEDGDLAQAWMDYSFFLDDKFSHCGVNAMHLVKKDGSWKIFHLMDTRRKSDCNE